MAILAAVFEFKMAATRRRNFLESYFFLNSMYQRLHKQSFMLSSKYERLWHKIDLNSYTIRNLNPDNVSAKLIIKGNHQ